MHKPIASFLKIVSIILFSVSFGQTQVPESEYGLLWEVTPPDQGNPSYLFGTMHVMDENIFNLPDSVFLGINACDGFATEVAFDEAMNEVVSWYIEKADEIEGKRRSEGLEQRLKSILGESKKGGDPLALFQDLGNNYQAGEDQETFLDAWLYRIARDQGKVVGGVEDIESQMVLLLDEDNLFGGGSGRVSVDFLKAAYIKGDLQAIQAYLESDEVSEGFREQVLVQRNYGMAEMSDSLIKIRSTFVAVGAAHLPGREGVIQLLKDRGYTLRRVEATYSGVADEYKDLPFQPQWQVFEDDQMGLRLDVPAKPFPVNAMDLTTMQFGMDLPGGFFYAFYRMQLPVYLGENERRSTITEVVSAMGNEIKERKAVSLGEFEGEEIFAAADDFDFRVRVLFDGKSMLFMLVGISEEMVRSDAANRFMESVETYIPPSIFSREWERRNCPEGRFSVKFPGEVDYAYDPEYKEDSEVDVEFRSYLYDLEDTYHSQYIMVRVSDLDPFSNTIPDSSWTYEIAEEFSGGDLEDLKVKAVTRNGILGWEAKGEADGYTMHFRQVNRGFRTYLLLLSALEQDSLLGRVEGFFDSFQFETLEAPKLKTLFTTDDFKVRLPEDPGLEEGSWAYIFLPGADGMSTWGVRDSISSTGFVLERYPLSSYYRADTLEVFLSKFQGNFGDDYSEVSNIFHQENGVLIADRELRSDNDNLFVYQRHYMDGGQVMEFSVRVPGEVKNKAFVEEFFDSIEFVPGESVKELSKGKSRKILNGLESEDKEIRQATINGLYRYTPTEEEQDVFMDWFKGHRDAPALVLGQLGILIAGIENEKSDQFLIDHFDWINSDPNSQSEIITQLFDSERVESHKLALELLSSHEPVPDDEVYLSEMIEAILDFDKDSFWSNEQLNLFIAKGAYYKAMTYELFAYIGAEVWDMSQVNEAYDLQVDIATDLIQNGALIKEDSDLYISGFRNLISCFDYVDWDKDRAEFANLILGLEDPSLQVETAILLLDQREKISEDKLQELADNVDYGFQLLSYLDGEKKRGLLPGKYFKQKLAAERSLLNNLAVESIYGPGKVKEIKLLERKKLNWKGEESYLYIYQLAMEEETEWMVGYSGPFPANSKASWPNQELTGPSFRSYFPNRLEGLTERWIRTAGDL